jgi:hypothetical protein
LYISSGKIFGLYSNVIFENIRSSINDLFESSVAGKAVGYEAESFTFLFIQYEYYLIVFVASIGLTISLYLRRNQFRSKSISVKRNLLDYYAIGSLVMFGITLSPVSVIGITRVLMIGMLFLSPYFVFSINSISKKFPDLGVDSNILLVVFCSILIINTGLFAAVVDEKSTQPNLNRGDILDGGNDRELFHLYQRYTPQTDVKAAKWLLHHRGQSIIYGSGADQRFPSYLFYTQIDLRPPPGPYEPLTPSAGCGYRYIAQMNDRLDIIIPSLNPDFVSFRQTPKVDINNYGLNTSNKIYVSDGSSVYLGC